MPAGPTTLVSREGSTWRYLDNGSNQGTVWRAFGFNDSAWKTGAAPLGYGDPVATTVSFGSSSSRKFITTYFRQQFNVTNGFTSLSLRLRRDDGAVVYINGTEVAWSNMPTGTISSTTLASSTVDGAADNGVHDDSGHGAALRRGERDRSRDPPAGAHQLRHRLRRLTDGFGQHRAPADSLNPEGKVSRERVRPDGPSAGRMEHGVGAFAVALPGIRVRAVGTIVATVPRCAPAS